MPDETQQLLREIRDLLVPVSDAYLDAYEQRQADRLQQKQARVRELLSTATRQKAWELADGTRTQREISKQSKLDEGATSKLFKALRELGAVDGANPARTVEVG